MIAPPNGQRPGRSLVYNHLVVVTQPDRIIRSAWGTRLSPIAYCLLPTVYWLRPIAYSLLPIAYGLLPRA